MKPVSNYYKQKIASGETRNFSVRITMTLADGTQYDDVHNPAITEADIMDNSFKILTASSGQSSFDIGSAIIGKCQFTLKNFEDEWADVDFFDAEATVWVKLDGDENYLRMGFFTVDEPQYAGSMVSLELLDNMWKFDADLPSLPLPLTIGQIVSRLCTHCGVTLSTQTFNGSSYQITELPDTDMNCRELLQYVAMIGCNFCQMDDQGGLMVKWYDTTSYLDPEHGNINDFAYLFTRNVGTDELTITGIKIKIGEQEYLMGNEGYVLVLDNPLITESNYSTILSMIWNRLHPSSSVFFKIRTFNLTSLPDIAPEVGDCVSFKDKDGTTVYSYLTNYTFTPSLSTASLGAITPTRALSQRYSKAVQAAVEVARQNVRQQIGIYDLSAQRMNQLAINAMGGYTDYDDLPTGGRVYYLSNAPITKNATTGMCQFPDSAVVYKTTGDGFFISTANNVDPQTHERIWTQGYTPSTGLLVELLTALRINCEQLYTGVLEVGGSQIGVTKPYIRVLDVNDDPVCTIDHDGITMHQGLIQSPDYEEETPVGTFSDTGMAINVNNSWMKSPYFALNNNGAYLKGEIQASSGQIGAATITQDAITIRGDVELYKGTGTFTFRPTDYYFVDDFRLTLTTAEGTTSSVTLVKHENGSDTTVGTYTATDEGVLTALLDHTIGTDEEDYYQLTISGSETTVLADDVILAYMGTGGFRGTLRGIFKGYLESRSGKIADMKYDGQHFSLGNNEITFTLKASTKDETITLDFSDFIPRIRRTYTIEGVTDSQEVAWGNKQNYISAEYLFPDYPPTQSGEAGDLFFTPHEYKTGKDELWRCGGGTSWGEVDLSGSWVTHSDSAPSQNEGKYGDVHIKLNDHPLIATKVESIYLHSGATTNPWSEYSIGGGGFVNYSSIEQNTGITYIDSSPIYQRTYIFSTPISLASNTWTNAIQTNHIAQVLSAEGSNANGDMIGLICRANSGYVQAQNLMSASQSLSALTIRYIRVAGLYEFNEDYQTDGTYYTFAPMDKETFLSNFLRTMIKIAKSAGNQRIIDVATFIESHLNDIIGRLINTENTGAGVNINFYGGGNENCVIEVVNRSPYSGSTYITDRQTLNGYEYCETYMQMMAYYSSRARFNWNGSTFDVTYETGNYNTVQQIGYKVTTVSSLQISALSSNLGIHYV